jgi:hypothetical protein
MPAVQYLLLVYTDPARMAELGAGFDSEMRGCLQHADELVADGTLLAFQQLEPVETAKAVRQRAGRWAVTDGPFAETKEMLAGFNLIEADSMEEAVRIAQGFPWVKYGCIEVRPVRDVAAVRQRVAGSAAGAGSN